MYSQFYKFDIINKFLVVQQKKKKKKILDLPLHVGVLCQAFYGRAFCSWFCLFCEVVWMIILEVGDGGGFQVSTNEGDYIGPLEVEVSHSIMHI